MSDEEIIEKLNKIVKEKETMYWFDEIKSALDLINRQQAEIEKLESANDEKFSQWHILSEKTKQHYADLYNEAKDILKAEAVKEFAEKLKEIVEFTDDTYECWEIEGYIDNLVKEMVGKKNE